MEERTTFEAVIRAVRAWLDEAQADFEHKRDTEESLWVTLDAEHHLAELLVHRTEFTPYRYVSFQVMDVRLSVSQGPVYVYFDCAESTLEEILEGLERGLSFMKIGV